MLLEALVACAGVTLKAVATSMGIALRSGEVTAEGDLDFRGTLGVDKDAPVGFKDIRLKFALDTDAPQEQLDTLLKLTERYCVVLQTLRHSPKTKRCSRGRRPSPLASPAFTCLSKAAEGGPSPALREKVTRRAG